MDRYLRNQAALLSTTFVNDETPVDADGAVTVTIVKADGSTVVSGAATSHPSTGVYQYNLAPQSNLNRLKATFTGTFSGLSRSQVVIVEIAGAHYFSLKELRDYDTAIANVTNYPSDKLKQARLEVETEFERFCGRAFVQRFHRQTKTLDTTQSTNTLWLQKPEPTEILTFTMDGVDMVPYVTDGTIRIDEENPYMLFHSNGWFSGDIVIEYEYGMDIEPPRDIVAKAKQRARGNLTGLRSRIDERATMMQIPDFGTFRLSTPGRAGAMTGVPEIDVVLQSYSLSTPGGVAVA